MRCGSPILPIGLDSTWIDSIWLNAICCLSLQHCCACRFLRVLSMIQSQLPSLLVRSMSWHIRFNDNRFRTGGLLPVISGCRKVFQNATLTLWRAPRVGRRFPGNSSSLREWLILFLQKSWQCWLVKINAGELSRIYPPEAWRNSWSYQSTRLLAMQKESPSLPISINIQ